MCRRHGRDQLYGRHFLCCSCTPIDCIISLWIPRNLKHPAACHQGRLRSDIKVAKGSFYSVTVCFSTFCCLSAYYWVMKVEISKPTTLRYTFYTHIGDVLRKSGAAQEAQQYVQSTSAIIRFSQYRESQSSLLAPDLRISCSLLQEHASRLALSDAMNRFMTAFSLRKSPRLPIEGALHPLLNWYAAILGQQVNTQSDRQTWSLRGRRSRYGLPCFGLSRPPIHPILSQSKSLAHAM